MRQWGLPRDYILSFLIEPGRILTPACIGEIMSGEIGAEVEPASEATVRLFVNERLNAIRPLDDAKFEEPISPWRIQQALLWARTKQTRLFHDEGYETEFKIIFERTDEKIARYMKTMAAFANESGGYLFLGVDDAGKPAGFDVEKFVGHDWDAFDKQLEDRFSPYIRWLKTVVDVPLTPEFRFDAELIRREAKERGVPKEQYQWIIDNTAEAEVAQIGVIYAYKADSKVICRKAVGRTLKAGVYYVRRMARNGQFEEAELNTLETTAARLSSAEVTALRLRQFEQQRASHMASSSMEGPETSQQNLPFRSSRKRRSKT